MVVFTYLGRRFYEDFMASINKNNLLSIKMSRSVINRYKPECAQYFWGEGSVLNIVMFKTEKAIFISCYKL